MLADSVGLALLVVLDTLTPAERLAFVLHDMFELPFEEIAADGRPDPGGGPAAGQPGRRRVKGAERAGARRGPGAGSGRWSTRSSPRRATATSTPWSRCSTPTWCCGSTRAPRHPSASMVRARRGRRRPAGAHRALLAPRGGAEVHPALVNGAAGVIVTMARAAVTVMGFTVADGKIVEIDAIADPERVRKITEAVRGEL